ncbi:MAG: protein-L-isoaspartate O-methyltransferase, partial [Proteobacteria bacterium]|nr:protein-L-isoaspartate O-methyltransferase [Pseudomonadota bacterium]
MSHTDAKERLLRSIGREIHDARVLDAIRAVPRELFVPPGSAAQAYDDVALSIGEGQTISQPLMVAIMLAALDVQPSDVVLDVGTGSGYQAALLSQLAGRVVGVERIPALAERARAALAAG